MNLSGFCISGSQSCPGLNKLILPVIAKINHLPLQKSLFFVYRVLSKSAAGTKSKHVIFLILWERTCSQNILDILLDPFHTGAWEKDLSKGKILANEGHLQQMSIHCTLRIRVKGFPLERLTAVSRADRSLTPSIWCLQPPAQDYDHLWQEEKCLKLKKCSGCIHLEIANLMLFSSMPACCQQVTACFWPWYYFLVLVSLRLCNIWGCHPFYPIPWSSLIQKLGTEGQKYSKVCYLG